jgi:hypothetical protein
MKLFDAYVYFRGQCPVGKNLEDLIREKAMTESKPLEGVRTMAQTLLDAEELFMDKHQRPLRQLQNPRYRLVLTDLPDGVTGMVTDGERDWITDAAKPDNLDTVYIRSLL